jgi:hypothetical protein
MTHENGHTAGITPRQERVLMALLSEPTIAAAAAANEVDPATIYRWLREPTFADAYAEARRDVMRQALVKLQALAGRAVDVLAAIMDDTTVRDAARITAARAILDGAIKAAGVAELEARVSALESGAPQEHIIRYANDWRAEGQP